MQIIILGMHRSGTSLTARMVNMMGAYFGPEGVALPPSSGNPRGHWERRDALALNNHILAARHCEWFNLSQWKPEDKFRLPQELANAMHAFIHGMDAHRPWFLKDPRLCLTLPAWRPLLEAPVAVIVYRDPHEIAQSLHTRNKLPLEYSIMLWEYYAVEMLNASRDMPRIFVQHTDMLARPVESTQALFDGLVAQGVRRLAMPSAREIEAFIDPKLYRSHPSSPAALSPQQQALAEIMQGKRKQDGALEISPASRQMATTIRLQRETGNQAGNQA